MGERFALAKDAINHRKHGVGLAFGDRLFEDIDYLVFSSFREIDGEDRFKVVGMVDDKLFTAVFVWRDALPRFISVRRSNHGEARRYRDQG